MTALLGEVTRRDPNHLSVRERCDGPAGATEALASAAPPLEGIDGRTGPGRTNVVPDGPRATTIPQ